MKKSWREMDERELVANLSSDDYYKVKCIQIFGEEKAKQIWAEILKERQAECEQMGNE